MHDIYTLVRQMVKSLIANQVFVSSSVKEEIMSDVYTKEQTEDKINELIEYTLTQINEEIASQTEELPESNSTLYYTKEEVDRKINEAIAATLEQIQQEINNE